LTERVWRHGECRDYPQFGEKLESAGTKDTMACLDTVALTHFVVAPLTKPATSANHTMVCDR
jgi:hypothetical protein